MIWLMGALGFVKRALSALLGLVVRYPMQAALIVALCLSAWLWHGRSKANAGRERDNAAWAAANKINHASIVLLTATLDRQSKAIQTWADTATAKQKAAQAALQAATARARTSEVSALQIDAERAGRSGGPVCPSGRAVMSARGEL